MVRAAKLRRQDLKDLKERSLEILSGPVSIWVDEYSMAIERDGPVYSAHFLAISKPIVLALNKNVDNGC